MKFLYEILEKQEKLFTKGGKLEKLYPLFEAGQSFLFSTKETSRTRVHIRDFVDTKRWMILVVIALLPATLFGIYNAGYQHYAALGLPMDQLGIILTGLKSFLNISAI